MLNKRILVLIFVVAFTFGGCLPIPTPPNEAPIITSTPITTATVGVLYTYNVNATDPDGNTLAYSLVVKPSGMTINSATGLIKWTPTAKGDYPVTVKVSDGTLSINQNFTIKVKAVNHAPSITSIPITTATVGVTYVYDVNATDPDGDTLTYSLTTKPSGMAINPANGLIWWVPTSAQVGSRSVTVKVSDGSLSITQSFKITVSTLPVVNQAPTITSSPNLIATVGIKYTYTIKAIDPNGDAIIYSLVSGPTGMTFNGIATINWKPTKIGVYGVTVKASDGELSDTQSFEIAVSKLPVVNHAPVITSTPDDIATVGEVYTYDVEATDPDGDTLTYSFLYYDKPTGMTINSATGLIKWIPTIAQVGNNWITVEVSDGSKSDTQHFTIEVSEPELTEIIVAPDEMTLIVGEFETFKVTAYYDNETTKIVTFKCHYVSSNSSIAYVAYGIDKVFTLDVDTATIFISYTQHNFLTGEEITRTDEIEVTVVSELVIADIDTEGRPVLVGTIKTDGFSISFDIRAVGQTDDGDSDNPSKYYSQHHFDNEYFTISAAGKFLKYNMFTGNTTPYWGTSWGDATNSLPAGEVTFSQTEDENDFVYAVSMSYAILGISAGDTFPVQIKARDFNDDYVQSYDGYVGFDGEYSFYDGLYITDTGIFEVTLP
ncbi:hypothetical protein ES705_31923 [subsurface metagenome]